MQVAKEKARSERCNGQTAKAQQHGSRKLREQVKAREQQAPSHLVDAAETLPLTTDPRASVSPDLDDLAVGFFYHYNLVGDAGGEDGWAAIQGSSCLLASVIALGSAGVTKATSGPPISAQTHYRYQKALQLTNAALSSESEVRNDSTLLAVNLLGTYEILTGCQKSLRAWHDHVQGAAALLQYRGMQPFETAEGGRLFMQTCGLLATSCLHRRFRIPLYIHQLTALADQQVPDPEDRVWRAFRLFLRFGDLYGRLLPNNELRSPEEAESVIQEALNLDRDTLALLDDRSPDWSYETVLTDGPLVFAGRVHVYPNHFTAQQFNMLSCRRIVLHDILLKALRSHPDRQSLRLEASTVQRIQNASKIVRQLQLDILASVPQHVDPAFLQLDGVSHLFARRASTCLGDTLWVNFSHVKDLNPWRSRRRHDPPLPPVRTSCGYAIQWPLYMAGAADAVNSELRIWVTNILRSVRHTMGIKQAAILADTLETGTGEQLTAYLHLGNDWDIA